MYASGEGHAVAIQALVQGGADVQSVSDAGVTALMYASCNGHVEAIRSLLQARADAQYCDYEGLSALAYASSNWHGPATRELLQYLQGIGNLMAPIPHAACHWGARPTFW